MLKLYIAGKVKKKLQSNWHTVKIRYGHETYIKKSECTIHSHMVTSRTRPKNFFESIINGLVGSLNWLGGIINLLVGLINWLVGIVILLAGKKDY